MIKKVPYPAVFLFSLAVLFSCSKFEETTSLGKDILNDLDSSEVSITANFKTFSAQNTSDSFSLPFTGDVNFGIHNGALIVGKKADESASGYFEFSISGDKIKNYFIADSIRSVILRLDTITTDTSAPYPTQPTVLYSASTDIKYSHNVTGTDLVANLPLDSVLTDSANSRYAISLKLSLNNSNFIKILDSASSAYHAFINKHLHPSNKDSIMALADSFLSSDTARLRFAIINQDTAAMIRFHTPRIIITYSKSKIFTQPDMDSLFSDTLYATYMNYKVSQQTATDSILPWSSYASGRTAVFALDMKPFWDTLENNTFGLHEILSASTFIKPAKYKNLERPDSSYSIRYLLSDKIFHNGFDLSAHQAFAISGNFTLHPGTKDSLTSADTLNLDINPFLQRLAISQPKTVYLYIQLIEADLGWERILWNVPKFQAVLTTLR